MSDQTKPGGSKITVQRLPDGYWQATIVLPDGPEHEYVQTASSFHDEEEANDWAEMTVSFLTCDRECCS